MTTKQWSKIAESSGLDIPDVERLVPALDRLEADFRPLVKTIPHDVEPAVTFRAIGADSEEDAK